MLAFLFLRDNVYIRKMKGEMKNVECNNSKERKILSIQIWNCKGWWYIGTTKTKQGTRQINMSITLYNALINYKKKQQYLTKFKTN